jgi:stalled ribosome rescue protein Dom34
MEKFKKTEVGLWIDHRKAVIVFVTGKDTDTKLISSSIEEHHRQSGVAMPADDVRQRELTQHLNRFYDEVVSCISDAESILILGPGEAKGELKARLEKENLSRRIVGVKTSDKMSDKQIVAVVRGHFNQRGQQRVRDTPDRDNAGADAN